MQSGFISLCFIFLLIFFSPGKQRVESLYKLAVKSCALNRKVCQENISTENCINYTNHVIKEEEKLMKLSILLSTSLKIKMPMIVVMKCDRNIKNWFN